MIAFACDRCGKHFNLKEEFAGRKTTCSACKAPLVVPNPAATIASPALPKIAFSCDRCGMKFCVPGECAGRKSTCPTCKNALSVPAADATVGYAPSPGRIKGTHSSLAQAGLERGVTLAGDFARAETLSLQNLIDGKSQDGTRYIVEDEIARGGMGVVMRAVDCDIRREVAIKYLLDQEDIKKKKRFVEEAQITGQLEHTNIVPIHELGVDAEKRLFFSMKMVKGRSLADILTGLRDAEQAPPRPSRSTGLFHGAFRGSAHQESEYTLGRLLSIFNSICNALAYAHARGVVHRDLKPANVMVGAFGEVYVMDWGLAKVLIRASAAPATGPVLAIPVARLAEPTQAASNVPIATPVAAPLATVVAANDTVASSGTGRVVTSRDVDADLTQEGAILGTPVYMPPEQAAGKTDEIDERSDIYSMGAILYEILALDAPIDREGGYLSVLLRVTQGQIEVPEKKFPERATKIPPELSAIAMKALARRKQDRYPTVESLRQDIERFMEGRSVSAKHDTVREMAVKLVKRNQGVSIATAAAAVLLLIVGIWSMIAVLNANARTRAEEAAKRDQAKKAAPSFVRAARLLINERQFEDAANQVNTAINVDENEPEARFVRAQLRLLSQDFAGASADLEFCLKKQPKRAEAKSLLAIAHGARRDDKTTLLALADELGRQNSHVLADQLSQQAKTLMASREELLQLYQVRIEAAWPGRGRQLYLDGDGQYHFDAGQGNAIANLEPLRGIPLAFLQFHGGQNHPIADLSPLKGMPLRVLWLRGTLISDLGPLKGMKLENLALTGCGRLSDLSDLAGMPLEALDLSHSALISDLAPLKQMPLKRLHMVQCPEVSDLSPLRGMKLTDVNLQHCQKVSDLSPLEGMPITALYIDGCRVDDLAPLKGMKLPFVSVNGSEKLHDLSPLEGMPLTQVSIYGTAVRTLAPLAGAKLTYLGINGANEFIDLTGLEDAPIARLDVQQCKNLSDLAPLKGLPIQELTIALCPNVSDLSPLSSLPLKSLQLHGCGKIRDLTPLKGLKLNFLNLNNTAVQNLEPLKEMPLTSLSLEGCGNLGDLSALQGLKLTQLNIANTPIKSLEPLRGMQLTALGISQCADLEDVSPLKGMPLPRLDLQRTKVKDLTPLVGMKLESIYLDSTPVDDLAPLKGMPLKDLSLRECKDLHDLSPLAGMALENVVLPPNVTNGIGALRGMRSLKFVDGVPQEHFWKLWDAAKSQEK